MSVIVGEVQTATVVNNRLPHEHLVSMQNAGQIKPSNKEDASTKSNFVENYKQKQDHDKNNSLSPN